MMARLSVVAYMPVKRPVLGNYLVEHKGIRAHKAGERCELCDKQRATR